MMRTRISYPSLLLFPFLLVGIAHGGVSTTTLEKHRAFSVRDVEDRVFFTSVAEIGAPDQFNIYQMSEDTSTPVPLLTPEEAKKYRLQDRFIVRPGKPHNILYATGQLSTSPPGQWTSCLVMVDADSTGVKILANNGRDNRNPSFSSDGRMIAFWSGSSKIASTPYMMQNEGYALHVVDVATGTERELVKPNQFPEFEIAPAWSPDNKRIAFSWHVSGVGRRIHVINADGTGLHMVDTQEKFNPDAILWVDDSKLLVKKLAFSGLFWVGLKAGNVSSAKEGGYCGPLEFMSDRKFIRTSYQHSNGRLEYGACVLRLPNLERVPEMEARLFKR